MHRVWLAMALAVGTVLVFATCLTHDFLDIDDDIYITQNPHVRGGLSGESVRWAFWATEGSNYWHPLTWLSHMLDVELYGLNAAGHHLGNVLLHAANAALLFLLLSRFTSAPWRSALVSALFAAHPLHVESVAWVSERKDVLSTFFWLSSIWAYGEYVYRRRRTMYAVSVAGFLFGLMAKPMLVSMPVLLVVLDVWPLQRMMPTGCEAMSASRVLDPRDGDPGHATSWRCRLALEKVPFLVFAVVAAAAALLAQQRGGRLTGGDTLPLLYRLGNAMLAYVAYLRDVFWPRGLTVYYPHPGAALNWGAALGAGILLLAITVLAAVWVRKRPYFAAGWAWYVVTLAPVSGVVQIGSFARADRYTYVPLIGVFIILAWGLAELLAVGERGAGSGVRRRSRASVAAPSGRAVPLWDGAVWPGWRRTAGGTLAAMTIGLIAARSCQQLAYWRNSRSLFEHGLRATGGDAVAHDGLGYVLFKEGRFEDAVPHFLASIHDLPRAARTHRRLGECYSALGRWSDAEAAFRTARSLRPEDVSILVPLGMALLVQGRWDDALQPLNEAVRLAPDDAETRSSLGAALLLANRNVEAVTELREAVRLNPTAVTARRNLGKGLVRLGRLAEAVDAFRAVIAQDPGFAEAREDLGAALLRLAQTNEVRWAGPE